MTFHDPTGTVKLNTGASMPLIGIGAWAGLDPEDQVAVRHWTLTALKTGYRHIDTSPIYQTETSVGVAIQNSGIPRDQLLITTKFPWNGHGRVKQCFETSLKDLGTDYIDLYLMHWPQHVVYEEGNYTPQNRDGSLRVTEDFNFNQSYAVLEGLLETGKCKAIGVSNFSIKNLEKLFETAKVVPAVNQVEYVRKELVKYCQSKGIVVVAYTPTGEYPLSRKETVRRDPVIVEIAKKYNATPTQIILSGHLARGVAVLPKSAHEGRQKENLKLPILEADDVAKLCALDRNDRISNREYEIDGEKGRTLWGWTYEQLGWA
ncbi:reductase AKOR2 [Mucidula mucida]|nr:reductase AKOR2 [Mucidula mucida]